jgi:hypothetical protein
MGPGGRQSTVLHDEVIPRFPYNLAVIRRNRHGVLDDARSAIDKKQFVAANTGDLDVAVPVEVGSIQGTPSRMRGRFTLHAYPEPATA